MLEEELKSITGTVAIYGAHLVAMECCRWIRRNCGKAEICGFIVTSAADNPQTLEGLRVWELSDYPGTVEETTLVIAMPEKYHREVELGARAKGFRKIVCVGYYSFSRIREREILSQFEERSGLPLRLSSSAHDPSWLDLHSAACTVKFPILYYRDVTNLIQNMDTLPLGRDCETFCGRNRNLCALDEAAAPEQRLPREILKLFMVYSGGDSAKLSGEERELPPWLVPLQAGSALATEKKAGCRDDDGENISELNGLLAEMTAAYWIWKNSDDSDYKGLCHYRRHFVLTLPQIRVLRANRVDVILTTPRYAPYGVGNMFLAETPVRENVYRNMIRAVSACAPDDREAFLTFLTGELYCPNNMVIARTDIYDSYSAWLFPILFRMWEDDRKSGYGHEKDRHCAYAAELLTSFYFMKNLSNYHTWFTDYDFLS